MKDTLLKDKTSSISFLMILELIIIVVFAVIPLFVNLPYRINIFLAWEGSYRMYLGQIPFKDFGLPLGYAFWVIPAIFFKIFGPYLFTLIKAQVFINIVGGITFSLLLKSLGVRPAHKFIAVLLFVVSYSFINFWPWYNHTVFFYQLLSMFFLVQVLLHHRKGFKAYAFVVLSAFFLFFSIFTKQDGGAFAFFITFFVLIYYAIIQKSIWIPIIYGISLLIISIIIIAPLLKYDFSYWFNYGQEPHSSRLFMSDFLEDIFKGSHWIKFYLLMIVILLMQRYDSIKDFVTDERQFIWFLITMGILVQALLVQVTSYIPDNVNIYFHSFAIAYLLSLIDIKGILEYKSKLIIASIMLLFWWSSDFWDYGQRMVSRIMPASLKSNRENVISKHTYRLPEDSANSDRSSWKSLQGMPAFINILMPTSTIEGIQRLLNNTEINYAEAKVLNMSELTPLSYELGFALETGNNIPLWYHKDVALFDREIEMYCNNIENNYYDLVLFQTIDHLNNFYPNDVKVCLDEHYQLIDTFIAPRQIQDAQIHVFIRKNK